MKRIINGRLYDTDTAKEIGWYDNGFGGGDFRYYYESLYRKRTGEYFLYGSGGPMSKYSESYGIDRQIPIRQIPCFPSNKYILWIS